MKSTTITIASALGLHITVGSALMLSSGDVSAADVVANMMAFANDAGESRTFNARGILNPDNAFFQSLGTNGRACATCHQPAEGWSITPAGVRSRFEASDGLDPLFRTNDGSNCEDADVGTRAARETAFSLLLSRGLIRVAQPVPAGAEFIVESVDDPYACATNLTSVSMYRRPLPTTNLRFLSEIMWDGRESPGDMGTRDGLLVQAKNATLGHAEAIASPTAAELKEIVDFELNLHTAQAHDTAAGGLGTGGAKGGPLALSRQPFFIGINDPVGQNPTAAAFTPDAFTLFDAWQAPSPESPFAEARQSVARGQALFNRVSFNIEGVSGLNDELGVPSIAGTCTTCHDTPMVGNHSVKAAMNIGVSDPRRRTPDMPLYTLRNIETGEAKQTTDPGRAMTTGLWKDVGRFKGPSLRGLASRAPYFHNGFATTLADVVNFYDRRFRLQLTAEEKADLVAFLQVL